jgi:hypothetical protein
VNAQTAPPKSPRTGILFAAAVLILLAAFLLHKPLKPEEVPNWNPLVIGYTVIMLAAALLFLAAGGALILVSLSRKRATMRRRLFHLITLTATSLICAVILDVVVSLFPALEIWSPGDSFGSLSNCYMTDAESGFKYAPNLNDIRRMDLLRESDLIITGQLHNPPPSGEPEDGMEMSWITDSDGFANNSVPERCDIAAVGDSFVGWPTAPKNTSWVALLSRKTGRTLYNTAVGGYSFQQELSTLKRYGLPKKPRIVLWGYFQGNDLVEAERFEMYQKSGKDYRTFLRDQKPQRPFPYNRPLARLLFFLAESLSVRRAGNGVTTYPGPMALTAGGVKKPIAFNGGYFYPLSLTREAVQESAGWRIFKKNILEAESLCAAQDARLIVVYMPTKLTVFLDFALPLFDDKQILEFAAPETRKFLDIDADRFLKTLEEKWNVQYKMLKEFCGAHDDIELTDVTPALLPYIFLKMVEENWNIQYEVLKEFCDAHNIEIIDTTPALRASLERGEWPYYCYDTHMNIVGNRVVAEMVSEYLGLTSHSNPSPGDTP